MNTVVIVGAGAAGDACAVGLRKAGFEGDVTLIGDEAVRPYERPLLSKQFLTDDKTSDQVFLRAEGDYERAGISLLSSRRAVGGDIARHQIVLDDGREVQFGTLILATGSTPRRLPGLPEADNILTLRSLHDAETIKRQVHGAETVLIVGAGFIGAEVASSARRLGKRVILVEAAPVPLERVLGRAIGERYATIHRDHGVDLRLGTTASSWVTRDGRAVTAELSDGSVVAFDVAIVGVGVTPNLELASALGLRQESGGIAVDESLRASSSVYAAGDIAAHLHPIFNRRVRVEHWQVAQRQGTAVAAAIAGNPAPYRELPWLWSDQFGINLQYVGHASGFDETVTRGNVDGESFSVFYLNGNVIDAVLSVNDGRTGRFSRDLITRRIPIHGNTRDQLANPESDMRSVVREVLERC